MKNKTMRILDAEKVYGEAPIFKEPRIIGDWILWLEQRPVSYTHLTLPTNREV